ncbi:carbohydrate binding domain-containing protein [Ekhidna sp.]|uniref:carbohydrate binding domain-containing protein n=1 Tax=Ekhidna sp. TaxID=2608089 RepID=UPI003B50BDD3
MQTRRNALGTFLMFTILAAYLIACSNDDTLSTPDDNSTEEDENPDNLAANGNFEAGTTGWIFFSNGGSAGIDNTESNGSGSNSAIIVANGAGNPGIKQERIGIDTVQAGDVVQIQFDVKGSTEGEGGIFNLLLFIERAEGESGDPITHIFEPRPVLSGEWTTFTGLYTIPDNAVVTGGISFLIESVCGGVAGCKVTANVDNVLVLLNP